MVTDDVYAALQAENAARREQLASAVQRIAEGEAMQTPPLSLVQAARPERQANGRRPRAAESTQARRPEEPTRTVEQALTHCPDGGGGQGRGQLGVGEWCTCA